MRLAIAVKRSKWERDLIRYGSREAVEHLYAIQNNATAKIYQSHQRQATAAQELRAALPTATWLERSALPETDFSNFDCVLSLGGDNHFVYVSGFLPPGMPVIGVNSDPQTSHGSLLNFDATQVLSVLPNSKSVSFDLEHWTRIECVLTYPDGSSKRTPLCTSEISVRNAFPDLISRYLIRLDQPEWEEQKSSGLILATGAGSTGWYRNAHSMAEQDAVVFAKDAPLFRFIARELGATHRYQFRRAQLERGATLEVVSEMDGQVSIDTHPEFTFDFPPGTTARFQVSDSALSVVRGFGS